MGVKIQSAESVIAREKLINEAKEAAKKQPRTTDTTDYEAAKAGFRAKCMEIRQYFQVTYPEFLEAHPVMETFRGAFGEELNLAMNLAMETMDMKLIGLLLQLQAIDNAMEYEAEKLCILTPGSWKAVWADELEPEGQEVPQAE